MVVPIVLLVGGGMGFSLLYLWARPYGGIRNAVSWSCCRPGGGGLLRCCASWGRKRAANVAPMDDEGPDNKPDRADMQATPTSADGSLVTSSSPPASACGFGDDPSPSMPPPTAGLAPLDHALLSPASQMRGEGGT